MPYLQLLLIGVTVELGSKKLLLPVYIVTGNPSSESQDVGKTSVVVFFAVMIPKFLFLLTPNNFHIIIQIIQDTSTI